MERNMVLATLLTGLMAGSSVAAGELERLEGDRPDFTEAASTVAPGHLQLESGVTFSNDKSNGVTTKDSTYPELLLRYGLNDALELRLGWDGWTHLDDGTNSVHGTNDASLAVKYRLYDNPDKPYAFSVIVGTSLPLGSKEFTSDAYDPEVKFIWAVDLSDNLAISGNLNASWYSEPDPITNQERRYLQRAASVSLGIGVSDNMGAYVEWMAFDPEVTDGDIGHYANGGMTYFVDNDLMLDARVGKGLNDVATDWFAGVGFAKRF